MHIKGVKSNQEKETKKMKKILKRVAPVLLTLVAVILSAAIVNAKPVTGTSQVFTLYPSGSKAYNESRRIYTTANEANLIPESYYGNVPTALKSQNTKIVSTLYRTNYAPSIASMKYKAPYLKVKAKGTTTVTYKIAKTTYKHKITVLKYTAPFTSIKVGNLKLTNTFKTKSNYTLSYKKYKNKTLKLQFKLKNGWLLSTYYLENPKAVQEGRPNWLSNGDSFKVTKKDSALLMYAYNEKTKQQEQCLVFFR